MPQPDARLSLCPFSVGVNRPTGPFQRAERPSALARAAACRLHYEPFAQAEIARLQELRLAAAEERIDADLALGRHARLAGELEALIAKTSTAGALRGQLMLVLYRSGRQAVALRLYRQTRALLVDELEL